MNNEEFYNYKENCGNYYYSDSNLYENMKAGKRGPYTKYDIELKKIAIDRVKSGHDLRKVAKEFKVPLKNLKRWLEVGAYRKKGKTI